MNREGFPASTIEHVAQPVGSELCFAAIVSSISKEPIGQVHRALSINGISEGNGETFAPIPAREVRINGVNATIRPLQTPLEAATSEVSDVMQVIQDSLNLAQPVALLHKKTADPEDGQFHWLLLTGRHISNREVEVMDPLQSKMSHMTITQLEAIVGRSMLTHGVYVYAITAG